MSKFSQTLFSSFRKTRTAVAAAGHNIAALNLILLGLILAVSVIYIAQVNGSATKGYHMRDLETRISSLQLENQKMEVAIAQSRSLETVSKKVPMLGLVQAPSPAYVSGGVSAVSFNR